MDLSLVWNTSNTKHLTDELNRVKGQNDILFEQLHYLREAVNMQTSDGDFCSERCIFLPYCELHAGDHRGCAMAWMKGMKENRYVMRHSSQLQGDDDDYV